MPLTHLGDSRKKPRLTSRARGISCDRRRLLFADPICKSLNVSSRITAKLRDLLKLHDSLPRMSSRVAAAVVVLVVVLAETVVLGSGAAPASLAAPGGSNLSLIESTINKQKVEI